MGRRHVEFGTNVTYQYCAPASGSHYNKAGSGPIQPRLYGPQDTVIPQGWIHNLEHGALVVLYTGTSEGATPEGQRQLQAFYDVVPEQPRLRHPEGHDPGSGHRPLRPDGDRLLGHRLGPGPAARDTSTPRDPGLLRRRGASGRTRSRSARRPRARREPSSSASPAAPARARRPSASPSVLRQPQRRTVRQPELTDAAVLALVKTAAGPGLSLQDVPMPVVGINDVLIRVHRTGICGTDLHIEAWDAWAAVDDRPAARGRPRVRR